MAYSIGQALDASDTIKGMIDFLYKDQKDNLKDRAGVAPNDFSLFSFDNRYNPAFVKSQSNYIYHGDKKAIKQLKPITDNTQVKTKSKWNPDVPLSMILGSGKSCTLKTVPSLPRHEFRGSGESTVDKKYCQKQDRLICSTCFIKEACIALHHDLISRECTDRLKALRPVGCHWQLLDSAKNPINNLLFNCKCSDKKCPKIHSNLCKTGKVCIYKLLNCHCQVGTGQSDGDSEPAGDTIICQDIHLKISLNHEQYHCLLERIIQEIHNGKKFILL